MSSPKVCLTGANGFIGRALAARLVRSGCDVLALSSKERDITRPFTVQGDFDHLIHLAAYNITHVGPADREMYRQVNVEGTRHVLAAVKAKRFIFLSTARVYKNEGRVLTEDSPIMPQGDYAASKWEAEGICQEQFKGAGLTIIRSANVVGEGQAPKAVIPVFFEQAYRHAPLRIAGSVRTWLQLLYVEDLVDLFEALVRRDGFSGVLNAAPQEKITLGVLAADIVRLTGCSSVIEGADQQDAPFAQVSSDKAGSMLGWQAKTSVAEILQRYNSYYRTTHGKEELRKD